MDIESSLLMICQLNTARFEVILLDRVHHLRCSKLQFLETNDIAVPCSIHFIPLDSEQILEGEDEFQVGGGRDIVVSPQLGEVCLRHISNICLEILAHLHHPEIMGKKRSVYYSVLDSNFVNATVNETE